MSKDSVLFVCWRMVIAGAALLFLVACSESPSQSPEAEAAYDAFAVYLQDKNPEIDPEHHVVRETLAAYCQAHESIGFMDDYYPSDAYTEAAEKYIQPVHDNHEFDGQGTIVGRTGISIVVVMDSGDKMKAFCEAVEFRSG